MVKNCDDAFSKTFLAKDKLSRLDDIINLDTYTLKQHTLSLTKEYDDLEKIKYTCTLPFEDIEVIDITSYIKEHYSEVKFSQESINKEIKLIIDCVKSDSYNSGFVVFNSTMKKTDDNFSFTIELNHLSN